MKSKYTGCVKVENSRRRSALTALLVREAFPLPPLKSNRDRERKSSSWKATGASACARIFYQWRHKSESVWRVGVMLAVLPRRWQKSAKKAKVCWKTRTVSQEHSVCQDDDKCSPSKGIRTKKGTLQLSMWSTGVLTWIVQAQSSEKVTVFVFFRMRYTALSLTLYCGNVNVCIIIVKPSWYCGLWQNVWMHHALHTFLFPQILKHRSYIAFK